MNDNQKSYLSTLNDEKSSVVASLKINNKILKKLITFMICSITYLVVTIITKNNSSHDIQTKFVNSFVSTIMNVCFAVSVIASIMYILILVSKRIRDILDNLKYKVKKIIFTFLDWVLIFPLCATIASLCFAFVFTFAEVNGTSMAPTVSNNSTIFLSYLEKIDRFDVVVAYITTEDSVVENLSIYQQEQYPEYYIKRVIGVPGDTVTWVNGVLTINGEVVEEDFFDQETIQNHIDTWTKDTGFFGNFAYKENGMIKYSTVIPEGYYFVMGDNRSNSIDSRRIGLIPKKNIEGVVKFEISKSGFERVE